MRDRTQNVVARDPARFICEFGHEEACERERAEADGRLIASAPDLLAACEAAVESLEAAASDLAEVQFDEKEREKAAEHLADTALDCRKAILKARGEA
jgi:hypothetical protein